jgi:ubiquinone/menaquinone biosynthesis C-methylase UbiE
MADLEGNKYDGFYKYDATVAENYERDRVSEIHWRLEDDFISDYLEQRDVDGLLDLPIGTGRFMKHYNRVHRLVGIDISEDMLREARTKVDLRPPSSTTILKKGDVTRLEEQSGSFDVTIVCRLFHLLPPEVLPSAIAELCRVTKHEVVAQSYGVGIATPSESRKKSFWTRLREFPISLMDRRRDHAPAHANSSSAKPWSHIQSYSHNQSTIDDIFLRAQFRIKKSVFLDSYEGSEVRITVYENAKA